MINGWIKDLLNELFCFETSLLLLKRADVVLNPIPQYLNLAIKMFKNFESSVMCCKG